mmetsp:Transcript_9355/g.20199  ORF Transcript_9355/g.20199 Transcript_9355/m.20199 type:complete len:541 (+) Transcript_9355:716-2338(+)
MCVEGLPRLFLDDISHGTLQNSRCSLGKCTAMLSILIKTVTGSFRSHKHDGFVILEWMEGTNRVGSPTNTGNDRIWQLSGLLEHLLTHFFAHDTLEIAHNRGEWVGPNSRSNQVVRVSNIGNPIAHGFVDSILQCGLSVVHWDYLCSQCVHSENIQLLAFTIHGTHVDNALQSHLSTNGGGGNSVLTRTSFGNNTGLSNAFGQQSLSNGVVDFVRTSVCQILAFEPNSGATREFGQTVSSVQRCGPANKIPTVFVKLGQEVRIILNLVILLFNFFKRNRQSLRDVLPSEVSKFARFLVFTPLRRDLSKFCCLIFDSFLLFAARSKVCCGIFHCLGLLFNSVGFIFAQSINGLKNGAAHDNTIGNVGNSLNHVRIRYSKPNSQRQIRLGTNAADKLFQIIRESVTGPSHSSHRNAIKKCGSHVGQGFNAIIATRGSNEWNIGKAILDASLIKVFSLFRWQIDHDESISPSFLGIFAKLFNTILQEGVEVSHEYDGNCQALGAGFLDQLQALRNLRCSTLNGHFVRLLDCGAIGFWVSVGGT